MLLHETNIKEEKQLYYYDAGQLTDIIDKSTFSDPSHNNPFFAFPLMIFKRFYWLEGYYRWHYSSAVFSVEYTVSMFWL